MFRAISLLIAASFMFLGCEKHEDPAKIKKAIEEQDAKFVEAFNKKDLDAIMSQYWNSPELVVMYPDSTFKGYDALKENWRQTFAMVDVKSFAITEQHIGVTPHMATDWGFWTYSFQPKGGPEMTMNGRYSQTWEEKNGKWVTTVGHASVPLPPPPPPAQPIDAGKEKKKK